MGLGLNGLPRMTTKELAVYLSLTGEERRKFDAARARRMEEMEQERAKEESYPRHRPNGSQAQRQRLAKQDSTARKSLPPAAVRWSAWLGVARWESHAVLGHFHACQTMVKVSAISTTP